MTKAKKTTRKADRANKAKPTITFESAGAVRKTRRQDLEEASRSVLKTMVEANIYSPNEINEQSDRFIAALHKLDAAVAAA